MADAVEKKEEPPKAETLEEVPVKVESVKDELPKPESTEEVHPKVEVSKEEPPKADAKTDVPIEEPPKTEPTKKAAPKAQAPPPEIASDPEEDDLSDLDDVLDEFTPTRLDSKIPLAAPSTSGPGRPAPPAGPSSTSGPAPLDPFDIDDDEFAKQLQTEMEQLLGQGGLEKQFEEMMKGMAGEGIGGPSTSQTDSKGKDATSDAAKKAEASFQETIKKTMERMQESGDQASAAAASSDGDDILAQMLKEMESGSFGGEGGDDEDFSKILMGMMEQLTNKEVLYEPMKELHEKFPKWIEANQGKVPEEDWKRYELQKQLVGEITERFERKGYSDSNAQDREYIVERMQKMQAAGSPPPDLVGDMNAAQEALQEIDQGCPTQ